MEAVTNEDRLAILQLIENAPQLAITDGWERVSAKYRSEAVELASGMGRLIQVGLRNGMPFYEAAEAARVMILRCYESNGNSLYYLNAISILTEGWENGSELRLWHARVYGP
jgi:hypothetical protein